MQANLLIVVKDNDHPILFKLFLQNKIKIESLIILDHILGFVKYWDARLDDIVWDDKKRLLNNYKSFVHFDIDKCKQLVKEVLI